ncbi:MULTISPECIES: HIT family protein [unclassified Microbacterium]|uniref:HIT family protein n=1 Tax=unclassified Microbacterium TaxID=2609290 RepID=UPI000CFE0051|nr:MULTISPECIES: HIT domain-containing protein [unclassified Microbacterium]PQZ53019.1 HIT family protein [Microbacterium sp. MYb43]PQZ73247.1 HIT family protein [Microbacterium sp. MYb40]PRB18733.1 HIT family protein [Microbacterium sp. MYb54]PRB24374.1 HIT family protein [Microbacterium sp. MYb50]PRB67238.1 HIT family protein [Microbacterium sp. MYb24]
MSSVGGEADCPFCEIVDRDDPDAREVYRDEHTVAFFPTEPAVLGHTMVIPRAHVPDIWHLSDDQARQLSVTILRIANAIRDSLHPDGLNVIQSNGEAASQSVMHVHAHLVPRTVGDRVGRIWPPESNYSEAQKDDAWETLRAACRAIGTAATPAGPLPPAV